MCIKVTQWESVNATPNPGTSPLGCLTAAKSQISWILQAVRQFHSLAPSLINCQFGLSGFQGLYATSASSHPNWAAHSEVNSDGRMAVDISYCATSSVWAASGHYFILWGPTVGLEKDRTIKLLCCLSPCLFLSLFYWPFLSIRKMCLNILFTVLWLFCLYKILL